MEKVKQRSPLSNTFITSQPTGSTETVVVTLHKMAGASVETWVGVARGTRLKLHIWNKDVKSVYMFQIPLLIFIFFLFTKLKARIF